MRHTGWLPVQAAGTGLSGRGGMRAPFPDRVVMSARGETCVCLILRGFVYFVT